MGLRADNESFYVDSAKSKPEYPRLDGEVLADVCIIGGGYTGLSAALHLAERGYNVLLLEAETVGWGASGRNGGQLTAGHNQGLFDLEAKVGLIAARALWDLSLESVALVKSLVQTHQIDCDLKPGVLHVAAKPGINECYRQTVAKLQHDYDYPGVRYIAEPEVRQMLGTDRYFAAQLWQDGAHLHPLNYALGLAQAAADAGARLFENSRVTDYETEVGSDKSVRVRTQQGQVRASYLLLACNGYLEKLEPQVAGKIMPINNFMLATEPLGNDLSKQLIRDDVAVADSNFVVNYFRLSTDKRLLWGGGETYSRRIPRDIKSLVRKQMLKIYPQLADVGIDYGWGGTLAITRNRMPHFERLDSNTFVAQGYSGHGIALATLGGKLMADAIAGSAEKFDLLASLDTPNFPGGTLLRWPGLVLGMLYYTMRDRI